MENSKLVVLLRSLSSRERRDLRDLVASPYFNQNALLLKLYDWLESRAPTYTGATRAAAHACLFPGEAPDEARLNHHLSFLLKLAETFLALEYYRNRPALRDQQLLEALAQRGLDKHYMFQLEKLRRQLALNPAPGAMAHFQAYSLELFEAERQVRSTPRQFNEGVQKAVDHLDTFYLLEKLRWTCYMYTSQAILATPYQFQLVDEICRFTGEHLDQLRAPAIEAYYRIFQLLTRGDADAHFSALKRLLSDRAADISPEDLSDIYQYAINYCNLQIMNVRENYVREAFDLYVRGIDSGVLLENGALSPWHFKNIINLALKLKHFHWTEAFIQENTRLLAPEFRSDALHYNLALLYYSTGKYAAALEHLNQVEFTDIHYSTGAKVMLCQIYYQNDDFDALESLLHAFNIFLRRNRLVSDNVRQAYLNFIQIMRKILRSRPDQYPAIVTEVQKMRVLAGKEWLLSRLAS